MSDSKGPRPPTHRKTLDGAPAAGVSRGTLSRAAARPAVGRHSAITRNLQNYASYKLWAEKVRSSWEPGKEPKG
jgi:hypothetical protein